MGEKEKKGNEAVGNLDFRKIVYFDGETIDNSLQSSNGGSYANVVETTGLTRLGVDAGLSTSVALKVPLQARLAFALTGRLEAKYKHEWTNKTTITSTDISRFEENKSRFCVFKNVKLSDIVNSLTLLRLLAAIGKIAGTISDEVDLRELSNLLNDLEGYDVFDIGIDRYVRFNQNAYLSNYRRNDLSLSKLTIYCIEVGEFDQIEFDYMNKLNNIQTIVNINNQNTTLAEFLEPADSKSENDACVDNDADTTITLYDAVCAYVNEV